MGLDGAEELAGRQGAEALERDAAALTAALSRSLRACAPVFTGTPGVLCAVLLHTGSEEVLCAAERLRAIAEGLRLGAGQPLAGTAPLGMVIAPQPVPQARFEEQMERPLGQAAAALRRAQAEGGGRVRRATE